MILGMGKPPKPNQIDTVAVPGTVGCMGLVGCPGTRIQQFPTASKRHFLSDMAAIHEWGANGVLCLVEPHELKMLNVEHLPDAAQDAGMWWLQLPIMDMDIPTQDFEDQWAIEGERIRHALRIGERVIIHCYAGLGRTGMIAARILVEFGIDPESAIKAVRASNQRRIQTKEQAEFVRHCRSLV